MLCGSNDLIAKILVHVNHNRHPAGEQPLHATQHAAEQIELQNGRIAQLTIVR